MLYAEPQEQQRNTMSAIAERVLAAAVEIDAVEIGPWKSNTSVYRDVRRASKELRRLNPRPRPTAELQGLDLYALDHRLGTSSSRTRFIYLAERGTSDVVAIMELTPGTRPFRDKVWTPHMAVSLTYQGRGLTKSLYQWALDSGECFLSSGLQTLGANKLWRSLSQRYEAHFIYTQANTAYEIPADVVAAHAKLRESQHLQILMGTSSAVQAVWKSAGVLSFAEALKVIPILKDFEK